MKKIILLGMSSVLLGILFLVGCSNKTDKPIANSEEHQQGSEKQVKENQQTENSSVVEVGSEKQGNEVTSIQYENKEYGFSFTLPESWRGYQIITQEWKGISIDNGKSEDSKESGPMLLIRHPKWTSDTPRQDIPIMILTINQWESLKKEDFHIGAAPIPPTELDQNSKYVFCLPARYNFAFPEGYEEVEDIMAKNPLKATETIMDVREIAWNSLSDSERKEVIGNWNDATVSKVIVDKKRFQLNDLTFEGKEVYMVTFCSSKNAILGDISKLVDEKSQKVIGGGFRD